MENVLAKTRFSCHFSAEKRQSWLIRADLKNLILRKRLLEKESFVTQDFQKETDFVFFLENALQFESRNLQLVKLRANCLQSGNI